jgi:hypothetical protein
VPFTTEVAPAETVVVPAETVVVCAQTAVVNAAASPHIAISVNVFSIKLFSCVVVF